MAQLSPSTLYYSQTLLLIGEFEREYIQGQYSSTEEITEKLKDVISQFNDRIGKPLSVYEPIAEGEPPVSSKFNRFIHRLQGDVNIMQEQVELLRASALFSHNFIATEILKGKNENAQANNKLKTLQLYSTAHDEDVIIFGDFFKNTEFIDNSLIPDDEQVSLLAQGNITLGRESDVENLTEDSEIKILDTSNGFLGNNQELFDPNTAAINPATGQRDYIFMGEPDRHAEIEDIVDGDPSTWVEYEAYFVNEVDRNLAQGFNFTYKNETRDSFGSLHAAPDAVLDTSTTDFLDWSRGPRRTTGSAFRAGTGRLSGGRGLSGTTGNFDLDRYNTSQLPGSPDQNYPGGSASTNTDHAAGSAGVSGTGFEKLYLDIEFDFEEIKTVNHINYSPFGLEDNKNNPVMVSIVQTSENGTDWLPVEPQNVWVGTDANIQAARAASDVTIGNAIWTFEERNVRYVRIKIEQEKAISANVGHHYYESKEDVVTVTQADPNDPAGVSTEERRLGAKRKQGPIPTVDNPHKYNGQSNRLVNGLVQSSELFEGDRWVIGVRDILIEEVEFKPYSVLVSKPFRINGIIDRVAIQADAFVPPSFGGESLWIKFYVSPNEGLDWFPISRIQDDFLGIPEIIAFNDPIPSDFREVGVKYHNVPGTVDTLRLKVEFHRPSDYASSSPILKSYQLKIRKR